MFLYPFTPSILIKIPKNSQYYIVHNGPSLQVNKGVWSSGMILALGDFLNKQEDKACERPWVQFPARPFIFFFWTQRTS